MIAAGKNYMRSELKEAIDLLSQALALNPKHSKCLSFRSNCYKIIKKYAESLKDALESIQLDPKVHVQTYIRAVKCQIIFGSYPEAQDLVLKFYEAFPNESDQIKPQVELLKTLQDLELKTYQEFNSKSYISCRDTLNQLMKFSHDCSRFGNLLLECVEMIEKEEKDKLCGKTFNEGDEMESSYAEPSDREIDRDEQPALKRQRSVSRIQEQVLEGKEIKIFGESCFKTESIESKLKCLNVDTIVTEQDMSSIKRSNKRSLNDSGCDQTEVEKEQPKKKAKNLTVTKEIVVEQEKKREEQKYIPTILDVFSHEEIMNMQWGDR